MKHFNLSEWALAHRSFVLYAMVALGLLGALSYGKLGQSEDPPFTFKVMVVRLLWPGASAREMEQQVTEKVEKKLQEAPHLDYLRSYSKPGETQIFVALKDSTPPAQVPDAYYQVRKKVGDIAHDLPPGVQGPFFNDEFGDTFGNLYALTGDGVSYTRLKDYADRLKLELLRIRDVAKVDILGEQEEKIYIEISSAKVATVGIDPATLVAILQQQNSMVPAGSYETSTDRVYLRPTGDFDSVESIRNVTIRANGRNFALGDVANVFRGYIDPPGPKMRFMGKDAIGLGVAMTAGGDIIQLGRSLDSEVAQLRATLPVGIELHQVSSMPRAVSNSIHEFVRTLAEAVIIVLVVSFFSLGMRTGLVVALSIPLVLAMTFLFMNLFDIGLHKISLGALILALGLLVDDAIIAVEMMSIKMEQGMDRVHAASFAYTSTAFPMLSGTLVTAAGFLPIATAQSSTGEYTRSIFQVTVIALLLSWVTAVVFIPYLGYYLLPGRHEREGGGQSFLARLRQRLPGSSRTTEVDAPPAPATAAPATAAHHDEHGVYETGFYRTFRALVTWCLAWRKTVVFATILIFVAAMAGFGLVQQQFFPSSTRPELLVDLTLPEGASLRATEAAAHKLETVLDKEKGIENYVSYIGTGSPRFYLPLDQQLPSPNFAQFVILAQDLEHRELLRSRLITLFQTDFSQLRANITRLENGPPVGYPVQFRVSGEDVELVRKLAGQVADVMRANANLADVHLDWSERAKSIRVTVDQNKARLLGISSEEISGLLQNALQGRGVTYYREREKLIEVRLRGEPAVRNNIDLLKSLQVPTRAGKRVPLSQVAEISYGFEEGVIWRRNRLPTITVRGQIYGDLQAPVVTAQVEPRLAAIRSRLPAGYRLDTGGAVEESAKGAESVAVGVPLFVFAVLTVLMLQLQSIQRTLLVVLTAPLGMIGVTLFLLGFNVPFGFVAMLGTIALSGMIMRNSVILVDQIEQDIAAGHAPGTAVIEATVRRFRPIVLTALAAILAMIPLILESVFFRPMAVAIMGGLFVATLLTLLFLPALYALWFRVKMPASPHGTA